jgi:hypothetical protein
MITSPHPAGGMLANKYALIFSFVFSRRTYYEKVATGSLIEAAIDDVRITAAVATGPTPTPTNTPIPPTPTNTSMPPTVTNTPTNTPIPPTPTNTPVPPTSTPVPPTATPPSSGIIFFDDFESSQGWTTNPNGSDTASTGQWERADPEQTSSGGTILQLGTTVSGNNNLVTGPLAGSNAGTHDIDNGTTSIRSPNIALPSSSDIDLSFAYYMAISTTPPAPISCGLPSSAAAANSLSRSWAVATMIVLPGIPSPQTSPVSADKPFIC